MTENRALFWFVYAVGYAAGLVTGSTMNVPTIAVRSASLFVVGVFVTWTATWLWRSARKLPSYRIRIVKVES